MRQKGHENQAVGLPSQSKDLTDLLQISRLVLKHRRTDELRAQVIDLLLKMFKADAANFFLVTKEGRPSFKKVVSSGIDEYWHTKFRRHYIKYDPFRKGVDRYTVCSLEQVISYPDLIKGAYYNDFLRPQSIHSQLCINLHSCRQLIGIIALFRFIGKPTFSPPEERKARFMAPYLLRALETSIVFERDAMSQSIVNAIALEIKDKGIILLNEYHDIIYTDTKAKEILSRFMDNDAAVGVESPSLPDQLSQCLQDFCSRNDRVVHYDLSLREEIQDVGVTIKHEVSADKTLYKIILKLGKSCLNTEGLLGFGLTARQSEITALVCKGLSTKDVSDKLCISQFTVDNHLRKIYEKMNVRNRTSLAHLILSQTNSLA
jgi:DNA-binding NarL/FixJ family response regulator